VDNIPTVPVNNNADKHHGPFWVAVGNKCQPTSRISIWYIFEKKEVTSSSPTQIKKRWWKESAALDNKRSPN
jgi:hypothetical protein